MKIGRGCEIQERTKEPSLCAGETGPRSPSDTYSQTQRAPQTPNMWVPQSRMLSHAMKGDLKEVGGSFTLPLVTEEGKRAALISQLSTQACQNCELREHTIISKYLQRAK